jgi:hypothetical protein
LQLSLIEAGEITGNKYFLKQINAQYNVSLGERRIIELCLTCCIVLQKKMLGSSNQSQMSAPVAAELLSIASNALERAQAADSAFPSLLESTKVSQHCLRTASGLNDLDYISLSNTHIGAHIKQVLKITI